MNIKQLSMCFEAYEAAQKVPSEDLEEALLFTETYLAAIKERIEEGVSHARIRKLESELEDLRLELKEQAIMEEMRNE
jgi:hypothetical protein